MTSLDLLEVQILPCSFIKDAFKGAWKVMMEGAEKKAGKITYAFKVVGENRMVAVINVGTEMAVKHLNAAYGCQTSVVTTPLRSFENFSNNVLRTGVQTRGPGVKSLREAASGGNLFWLQFTFNYSGVQTTNFLSTWKDEAEHWLGLRQRNDLQLEILKVVGQRKVHMFISVPGGDLLDDLLWTSPMMKELGNQVKVEVKSIVFIDDYFASCNTKQ